ncbi:MAG: 50S ribosomal protein L15 [Acidobacteria bacterium]|nr:50S ribosomal protein L15 [Acidobacteriota bacterium]
MGLHGLAPAPGSKRNRKRVGRGRGSGQGRTAGRGDKGQLSRSGYSRRRGFEGGQMPLQRRLPKRGFAGPGREPFAIVNLKQLADFPAGAEVTPERLVERGLVRRIRGGVKVLGDGELKVALHVKVHRFSRAAAEKIEKAGGRAEVLRN